MNRSIRITRSTTILPCRLWFMLFVIGGLCIGNAIAANGLPATPVNAATVCSDRLIVDITATGSLGVGEQVVTAGQMKIRDGIIRVARQHAL